MSSVPDLPGILSRDELCGSAEHLASLQTGSGMIPWFPGGRFAATVPAGGPELVNWQLSADYHAPKSVGGHVRIYTKTELRAKLRSAGLDVDGYHRAHALHSPYWWLKCAVGPRNDDHRAVATYRAFLEWDIVEQPVSTRIAERFLSPVLGKSSVHYGTKLDPA